MMGRATLENPKLVQAAREMTYAEFLATDFENHHVEWVNGRVIEMPPISDEHSDVGGLLEAALRGFAEEKKLGIVKHDPYQMKTGPGLPGRVARNYEYEKGGVPEFWLIDPERKQAEFYLRNKRGIYKLAALDENAIYHSTMMYGVWIDPEWLWKSPLPTLVWLLKTWGVM